MNSHRDACRRQHRVLGHFLAIQAWLRGLDCIVLGRADLETFLELERFKAERVKWLIEDLAPWFPHSKAINKTRAPSSLHSLYLSRLDLSSHFPKGAMSTTERIKAMPAGGPRTAAFHEAKKGYRRVTEADIVRYLAILDSGLEKPTTMSNVQIVKA